MSVPYAGGASDDEVADCEEEGARPADVEEIEEQQFFGVIGELDVHEWQVLFVDECALAED